MAKTKVYQIDKFKEVIAFKLPEKDTRPYLKGVPAAIGHKVGEGMLNVATSSSENANVTQQLIIRIHDGSIFSLNSNYINNSKELINEILHLSELNLKFIEAKDYFAWKKGKLKI